METYIPYGQTELDHLSAQDPRMARLIQAAGHVYRPARPGTVYASLVDSILGQQISTSAHETLRARVAQRFGPLTPETVAALTDAELQGVGTTWRKVSYIRDLTDRVISGQFDPEGVAALEDDQVIAALSSLKGIGVWTAEMILTFTLLRPDVLSYGDLAIRRGIMKLYGLEELTQATFHALTDKFSPYRTTAALYLWWYANPACPLTLEFAPTDGGIYEHTHP